MVEGVLAVGFAFFVWAIIKERLGTKVNVTVQQTTIGSGSIPAVLPPGTNQSAIGSTNSTPVVTSTPQTNVPTPPTPAQIVAAAIYALNGGLVIDPTQLSQGSSGNWVDLGTGNIYRPDGHFYAGLVPGAADISQASISVYPTSGDISYYNLSPIFLICEGTILVQPVASGVQMGKISCPAFMKQVGNWQWTMQTPGNTTAVLNAIVSSKASGTTYTYSLGLLDQTPPVVPYPPQNNIVTVPDGSGSGFPATPITGVVQTAAGSGGSTLTPIASYTIPVYTLPALSTGMTSGPPPMVDSTLDAFKQLLASLPAAPKTSAGYQPLASGQKIYSGYGYVVSVNDSTLAIINSFVAQLQSIQDSQLRYWQAMSPVNSQFSYDANGNIIGAITISNPAEVQSSGTSDPVGDATNAISILSGYVSGQPVPLSDSFALNPVSQLRPSQQQYFSTSLLALLQSGYTSAQVGTLQFGSVAANQYGFYSNLSDWFTRQKNNAYQLALNS